MFARHRLKLGNIKRGEDIAQSLHSRRLRCASVSGRRLDRIAGIEHHGAALFHVGVDTIDGVLRRLRGARHNGPVDQRKEGQFVVGGIDADGVAGFQRRALREKQRQSGHAGLDDGIHVGIAGDDISQPGLRHRLDCEIVVVVGTQRLWRRQHRGQDEHERQYSRRGAPSQQRRDAAAEHGDDDRIDQE